MDGHFVSSPRFVSRTPSLSRADLQLGRTQRFTCFLNNGFLLSLQIGQVVLSAGIGFLFPPGTSQSSIDAFNVPLQQFSSDGTMVSLGALARHRAGACPICRILRGREGADTLFLAGGVP